MGNQTLKFELIALIYYYKEMYQRLQNATKRPLKPENNYEIGFFKHDQGVCYNARASKNLSWMNPKK